MSYADRKLNREQQIEQLNKAVDRILVNTKRDPEVSDFIAGYLMRGFEMLGLQGPLLHIAEKYTPAVPCSSDEKSTLQRRIDLQKMLPGTKVPQFSLVDIDGDTIKLENVTNKYKLIIFWASWCPHCDQLLPNLYQWYMNRSIDMEVIAISVDSDKEAWKQFVRQRGYNWINCNEPGKWDGKVTKEYNIYATPTMFLIDSDDEIITKPLTFNDFLDAVIGLE
jgi:thiol-disulfide isomerase/thioredoxin